MLRKVLYTVLVLALTANVVPAASAAPKPAPDPRAWPSVYEPVSMSAAELLASSRRVAGDTRKLESIRITYDVHDGGLDGTEQYVRRGQDTRDDETLGPLITAGGRYKGERWDLGENGYTLIKRGIHQRDAANARALEQVEPGENVRVLGRLRAPADVYVLRVAPSGGREERDFYDATTFHLVRVETYVLDKLVVTTYDDYRTVGVFSAAYRTEFSDGHPENDSFWTIREFIPGGPVNEAEVQIAHGRRAAVTFPAGVETVRLPARIDEYGRIIVRVVIKGRGLDFQLDSGADGIFIDRSIAKELGLRVYGQWCQTVAGTFSAGKAVVPNLKIGKIGMDDVVINAVPFTDQANPNTKIVGLLGFDFIAGGVIKIDYQNETVDAMRYDHAMPKDAFEMDAILDDGVPMIEMGINGAISNRFIVDTGATDVLVFSGFSKKHPEALQDNSPGQIFSYAFNSVSADGVGGKLHTRGLALDRMQIGIAAFKNFLALVMSGDQPAFEGEDTDGVIGATVLSAFDVYLDYGNSRVLFAPNKSAKEHGTARGIDYLRWY